MKNDPQQTLEELIHRELSKLPERPAPDTLVPRVLAEIKARAHRHWWQRPWSSWPTPFKLVSLPLLLGGAGSAVFGATLLWNYVMNQADFGVVSDHLAAVSDLWEVLGVLASALVVISRAVFQPWLLLLLFVPLSMYLVCVGLGTLCYRMAFHDR